MDKIIIKDSYFSPYITIDNTNITVDSANITLDITNNTVDTFRIEILPRKYSFILNISIKEYYSNEIQILETTADIKNKLLNINLFGFIPKNDAKYEFIIKDVLGDTIWLGECMYSTKNIQNYQLNNSDENNLKL